MTKVPVQVQMLFLLLMVEPMNFGTTRFELTDYDLEWDKLFGHLSLPNIPVGSEKTNVDPKASSQPTSITTVSSNFQKLDETGNSRAEQKPQASAPKPKPPEPPSAPFVFDSDKMDRPSIGAHSYGNMEGIAIAQGGSVSVGILMNNSPNNILNTLFGKANSNVSRPFA